MQFDMVFEGGGAKGMAFVGALQVLEARGFSPARLLGTSAGSIMATFLAAGYQTNEMESALNEELEGQPVFLGFLESPGMLSPEEIKRSDIRRLLQEVNVKLIPDVIEDVLDDAIANALASSRITQRLFTFIERGGFYAAGNFLDWLREKLNEGIYPLDRGAHPQGTQRSFGGMNLAQFHQATGADLTLVAADTSQSRLLVLNHRTAPDCPLIWAVRMSMSVPLLWEEVEWQADWGLYRGQDITSNAVVDGGLLSNFPIELFISNQPHILAVMGEKTTGPRNVLGFLIDENLEVPDAPPEKPPGEGFDLAQLSPVRRIKNLMNTMLQAHDKSVIEAFEDFVIRLPAKGFGTIEFGMTEARRQALVTAGRTATEAYFNRQQAAAPEGVLSAMETTVTEEMSQAADKIATGILER